MIISCEKCNKKFELSEELVPDEGRLLQCGSCSYKWHYIPVNSIKLTEEVDNVDQSTNVKNIPPKQESKKINKSKKKDHTFPSKQHKNFIQNKKSVGFLSYTLIIIISFIAIIVLLDTFKNYLSSFIPNIDFYLSSLYESLKDIFLFFKDLIK